MCSGIRIICKDGSVLVARTLEFDMNLDYIPYSNDIGKGIAATLPGHDDIYIIDGVNSMVLQ